MKSNLAGGLTRGKMPPTKNASGAASHNPDHDFAAAPQTQFNALVTG
jgi:hypothetical protein